MGVIHNSRIYLPKKGEFQGKSRYFQWIYQTLFMKNKYVKQYMMIPIKKIWIWSLSQKLVLTTFLGDLEILFQIKKE